jgi:hypothetical protein
MPAQTPMARSRSAAGKVSVMIDRVARMIIAAPTPIAARVAISTSGEPAQADATEPATNTSSPRSSTSLRPKRSPSAPVVSSSPAKTRT